MRAQAAWVLGSSRCRLPLQSLPDTSTTSHDSSRASGTIGPFSLPWSGPGHASQRQPGVFRRNPGGGPLQDLRQDRVLLCRDPGKREPALVTEHPLPPEPASVPTTRLHTTWAERRSPPRGGESSTVQVAPGRRTFRCSMRAPLRLRSRRRTVSVARVRAAGCPGRAIRGTRRCFRYSGMVTFSLALSAGAGPCRISKHHLQDDRGQKAENAPATRPRLREPPCGYENQRPGHVLECAGKRMTGTTGSAWPTVHAKEESGRALPRWCVDVRRLCRESIAHR